VSTAQVPAKTPDGPAGEASPLPGPTAGPTAANVGTMPAYRPPSTCPVCSDRLQITQLGCPTCGTALSGQFTQSEFDALDDADRDVLRVFLASRGNMKELERHLGVSYPTARARFDDLLRKLGLAGGAPPREAGRGTAGPPAEDPRLATLRAVAKGDLDVEAARKRLT
jgi:hypothetical protein